MNQYNENSSKQNFPNTNFPLLMNSRNRLPNFDKMCIPPQHNFHRSPLNPSMAPAGFIPPNFHMKFNNAVPPHHLPPARQQVFYTPPNQALFIPGNSSGGLVNPPISPFPNSSNIPFLNPSDAPLSGSQIFRQEIPRARLPLHQQQSTNQVKSNETKLKTADEIMVEQFLMKIGKLQKHNLMAQCQQKPSKYLKICEAKKLHCRAKCLINKLEDFDRLPVKSDDTGIKLKQTKEELKSLMSVLSDEDVVEDLRRKIAARKKKRIREKKIKEKVYTEKLIKQQKMEEANKTINEWQQQEMANLEKKLREEELQKQLDAALLGMRRELSTISKSLDMINSLANLRKARLNSLKNKGRELPSSSVTETFNDKIRETKSMLLSYKQASSKKIDSLKMFLEAEHEQAKREIEKKKAKQQLELKQKLENERNFNLFGEPKKLDPFDPMWPVQELHKQSEMNLPALVQYRRLWDQYLHPDGTTVPFGWVEPIAPSRKEWKKYLENSNNFDEVAKAD